MAASVIAVGNLKGGVGKSTLSVNLAAALAGRGLPTALFDTDPQQTAAAWTEPKRMRFMAERHPIRDLGRVGPWLQALDAARSRHGRIVIDLPAVLSPALAAAFLAADVILIPTSLSPVDLDATRRTLKHARVAALERGDNPPEVMLVPMLARRGWLGRTAGLGRIGDEAVATTPGIGFDPLFAEAYAARDWIGGHARRSRAHREVARVASSVEAALARAA